MTIPIERFSDSGRKILTLALQESQRLKKDYIGIEHLLLAVLLDSQNLATQILKEKGIALDGLRMAVERTFGPGNRGLQGQISLSPGAQHLLEVIVVQEADNLQQPLVKAEHIFLGLLRESEGAIVSLFSALDISAEEISQKIIQRLK